MVSLGNSRVSGFILDVMRRPNLSDTSVCTASDLKKVSYYLDFSIFTRKVAGLILSDIYR